eukprot:1191099-Prorocentrum_minimum.AAC.3
MRKRGYRFPSEAPQRTDRHQARHAHQALEDETPFATGEFRSSPQISKFPNFQISADAERKAPEKPPKNVSSVEPFTSPFGAQLKSSTLPPFSFEGSYVSVSTPVGARESNSGRERVPRAACRAPSFRGRVAAA